MKVVVALGGNALLQRGDRLEAEVQRANVARAAEAIAALAGKHGLVVTHGNGPQVGLLALQSEAYREVRPYPLDILGAESEGMIGYLIETELQNRLPKRNRLLETPLDGGRVIQAASSSRSSPRRAGATFQGSSSSMRLIGCSAMRSMTWRR